MSRYDIKINAAYYKMEALRKELDALAIELKSDGNPKAARSMWAAESQMTSACMKVIKAKDNIKE